MSTLHNSAMIALGWALLLPGLIFVVLPPPFAFGAVMVLAGVGILAGYSRFMRRLVQRVRAHWAFADRAMAAIETRLPAWFRRNLRRTNPAALILAMRRKRAAHHRQETTIR